jgi:large subunit ribosomal protein L4
MMKVPVYNMEGELVEELQLDEGVLGGKVAAEVLRQAIVTFEANQRAGTHKTKTRAEVAYSDKKPWPQKHTGHARAGTRASPLWPKGGIIHGPKPRDYSKKLNKKMRRRAVASALLAKLLDSEVKVLQELQLTEQKTKRMAALLKKLGIERSFLLVIPEHDATVWRCTRNIRGAAVSAASELNAYEMIRARDVLFTRKALDSVLAAVGKSAPAASA